MTIKVSIAEINIAHAIILQMNRQGFPLPNPIRRGLIDLNKAMQPFGEEWDKKINSINEKYLEDVPAHKFIPPTKWPQFRFRMMAISDLIQDKEERKKDLNQLIEEYESNDSLSGQRAIPNHKMPMVNEEIKKELETVVSLEIKKIKMKKELIDKIKNALPDNIKNGLDPFVEEDDSRLIVISGMG